MLARDLVYGDVPEANQLLDEVIRLLEAYSHTILTSTF